jgi:hypothetical protein
LCFTDAQPRRQRRSICRRHLPSRRKRSCGNIWGRCTASKRRATTCTLEIGTGKSSSLCDVVPP